MGSTPNSEDSSFPEGTTELIIGRYQFDSEFVMIIKKLIDHFLMTVIMSLMVVVRIENVNSIIITRKVYCVPANTNLVPVHLRGVNFQDGFLKRRYV